MGETKRRYWEKEAIRISEMMHRGFYEKTIHPKDLDDYLSQERFSWIGAVEGENYLSKKDAITDFSSQRDLQVLSERTLSRYPDLSPRQKLILELLSRKNISGHCRSALHLALHRPLPCE